jgi:hypothetical protein
MPAPTPALRSISVEGYWRKDNVVNRSRKAATARALAAENREATSAAGADGGLMEWAMPSDSGEQMDGRLTVPDGAGPVSVGERPR